MSVVILEGDKYDEFVAKLVADIRQQLGAQPRNKWVDGEEAMALLHIKSKTTLQKLRDEGKIRYSQPEPRSILYDRDSLDAYLDKHAKDTF